MNLWQTPNATDFGGIPIGVPQEFLLPLNPALSVQDRNNIQIVWISDPLKILPPGLSLSNDKIIGTAHEIRKTKTFEFVVRAILENRVEDKTILITVEKPDVIPLWTIRSGYNLGTISERSIIDIPLPLNYTNRLPELFEIELITGNLPPGLRIVNRKIIGSAFEVARITEFNFVVRAKYLKQIEDITFSVTIEGRDAPQWITNEGLLPVGNNNAYFVLDNSYIEFQLSGIDNDTSTGQKLLYSIYPNEGELPPGLTLSNTGKISGFTQPAYAFIPAGVNGNYDSGLFDGIAYDFGIRSDNGFDDFGYDSIIFDYFEPAKLPNKLNRNYEFIVTISDGDSVSKRNFKIYVVGDDFFTADNLLTRAGNNTFTADSSYLRAPIWLTPSNLGYRRANNYQTFRLEVYENQDLGVVAFSLDTVNPDTTPSVLPPGLQFDSGTGEIIGRIPYQPAITKTYNFTVTASRIASSGEIASSKRTFTVNVIGEIESTISWITESDLGSISANLNSTISVKASSTLTNSQIIYKLVSGNLPPGLRLSQSGELIGKVTQFSSPGIDGLLTIDQGDFTLDFGTTTLDRVYEFGIKAFDALGYSAVTRIFKLSIETPDDRLYSNLVVKPFLKPDDREIFREFIINRDVFVSSAIYRPEDPNFGIQQELKMLVYAGIETKTAAEVVSVIGRNHKPKRFVLGEVKKAVAKIPATNEVIYEVIYVEVIDPLEIGKSSLPLFLTNLPYNNSKITVDNNNQFYNGSFTEVTPSFKRADPMLASVDRNDIFAGDPQTGIRFPASVSLWRTRIKELGRNARDYLPLWMRSSQEGSVLELGFIKAIPLCYCKPGTADDILLNIKNYNFDFKQINYVVDRYIIDSVTGYSNDKYIIFKNDRTTIT